MGLATNDKFYQENDVKIKKSDHISSEERNSHTESARFFSYDDDDVKLLSVAAEYYKACPEQAQSESPLSEASSLPSTWP